MSLHVNSPSRDGSQRSKGAERSRKSSSLKALSFLTLTLGLALMALAQPAAAAPSVTRVEPSSGPLSAGQVVLVTGKGFTSASAVDFGSTPATNFRVVSDTQIVATAPAASADGKVLVAVTVGSDTNTSGGQYDYMAPTIKTISPGWATDAAAEIVTITGEGFLGTVASEVVVSDGTNTFAAQNVWVLSNTQMVIETPIDDSGSSIDVPNGNHDIVITRNSVASTPDDKSKFLIAPAGPTITDLTSDGSTSINRTGSAGIDVGDNMVVVGTNLWGLSDVALGTTKVKAANITINTAGTNATFALPNRSTGPVDVIATNAAGSSATGLKTKFSYLSTSAPTINALYPDVVDKSAASTVLVVGRGLTGVEASNITLTCGSSTITLTAVNTVSDTSVILTLPTNSTAETCDLQIASPGDNTKTTTKTAAMRYI